ncbi:hypothetical protein D3C80_579920 [compost metagenome]
MQDLMRTAGEPAFFLVPVHTGGIYVYRPDRSLDGPQVPFAQDQAGARWPALQIFEQAHSQPIGVPVGGRWVDEALQCPGHAQVFLQRVEVFAQAAQQTLAGGAQRIAHFCPDAVEGKAGQGQRDVRVVALQFHHGDVDVDLRQFVAVVENGRVQAADPLLVDVLGWPVAGLIGRAGTRRRGISRAAPRAAVRRAAVQANVH